METLNNNNPSKTTETSVYTNIIGRAFVWMIGFSILTLAVTLMFGATEVGIQILAISTIIYVVGIIYDIGRNWPTIEGGWSIGRFMAGFFMFPRMGYERPGLKTLPWGKIFGLTSILSVITGLNQFAVQLQAGAEISNAIPFVLIFVAVYAAIVIFSVVFSYGLGYLFGGNRQKLETA